MCSAVLTAKLPFCTRSEERAKKALEPHTDLPLHAGQEPSAMNSAPAGQIAASLIASMNAKISKDLETDNVKIADAYGCVH